ISRAKSNARNYGREMQEVYQKNIYSEATLDKITVLQECSIKSFEYIAMMITSEEDELSQKLYNAILAEEDKADELYGMIDQSVIESISDTTQNSIAKIDSLKAIRKLEKITDRAVGIADLIMFAQSGGEITH
ncbi:MAG: PhoU domain-containing protein, partial [Campylobacterota bacterium]